MTVQYHGTWGRRVITRQDPYTLTTILYLLPHKRCSWHSHKHVFNQFFVISGKLEVKTDIGPNGQRNYTTITDGQTFTVPPGVTHEFRTLDRDTIVEEIAYEEFDPHDNDRKQLGGDLDMANE